MMICAYCLQLGNNAAMPMSIEWSNEDGTGGGRLCVGPEMIIEGIRRHRDRPGFVMRSYQLDIRAPEAVTTIDGTAVCGVHAGTAMRWPLT